MMDLFDPAAMERVEVELDAFVEKRAREAKEANAVEAAYAESVRRFHQKRHQQNAQQWLAYHDEQLRRHEATFAALASHHRAERNRYAQILGTAFADADGPPEAA
jgi:Holliday junction resolvase-like predicted endonuclease